MERDFLRLCRLYGLPRPEVDVLIDRMTVDFLWRDAGLVVETDSHATHGGTVAFEDDRERDMRLRHLGFRSIASANGSWSWNRRRWPRTSPRRSG